MKPILKSQTQNLHYLVLQGLLLLAFMFHQLEDWHDRPFAFFSLASIILFVLVKKYRQWFFLLFLLVGIARYLYIFPNLANHSNLNLFIFLALLPYQVAFTLKKKLPHYENLIVLLRSLVFILYFFTFFHKLNWDFIFPGTSCASAKLKDYLDLIPRHWTQMRHLAYVSGPWFGLIIEGIIPLTLVFKQTRKFSLFFLVGLHFLLAPMGFTDFSSLAMAMTWCFVDLQKIKIKNIEKHLELLIGSCLFFEIIFGFSRFPTGQESYEMLEGFLFVAVYTPFLLYYLFGQIEYRHLSPPRNRFGMVFTAMLFIFGASNYLGLRTAGNFSMFSNLKTEGSTSNHILLASNPFKIFSFQEDGVEILEVADQGKGIYKRMPFNGQIIPRVEFSRLLDIYRIWGDQYPIAMKVRYRDEIRETQKAGFDPKFDLDVPWIYKKLLKFRFIQPQGRQYCYW